MKVMFVGDVHGDWTALNAFIAHHQPDILIQAGDFGYYWDHNQYKSQGKIKPGKTKIYWVAGNHENHDILKKSGKFPYGSITEIEENIFFCAFGSTLTLPDRRKVLFCGGADSIDKQYRIIGKSWWRNETIQNDEFDYLAGHVDELGSIDIVVSHTCPTFFDLKINGWLEEKYKDPSCEALNQIFKIFKPSLWFFGHFHMMDRGKYEQCEWFVLDCIDVKGYECYRDLDNLDFNEDEKIQEYAVYERRRAEYNKENERRKDPNYIELSEWPEDLNNPPPLKKDLDF